jgi:hypothetical protein
MSGYAGAIFSPINCTQSEAAEQVQEVRTSKGNFEIIFDPQLYVPATDRGKLKKWAYFPKDFDTADPTSFAWWSELNKRLALACQKVKVDSVCSPVIIPRVFDDRYYLNAIAVGDELFQMVKSDGRAVLQTVLASLTELNRKDRCLELASIVSATDAGRVYLVFIGKTSPRRELTVGDELVGAMRLINALERNNVPVTVGFCSSDVLLWKTAGATACASGKFFNLRRFTRQRFEEPTEGGGQFPYWFEESLVAFLRQSDLIRVRRQHLLSDSSKRNPFGQQILALIDEARTKPPSWLALSWRHFLFWFADVEGRLSRGDTDTESLLRLADQNWSKLDAAKVLMEERENNGT